MTRLTATRAYAVRNTKIREFQQFVTDLAERVYDSNVNREIYISVRQQLDYRIRFVITGAVRMATLNTAAVFEDVADRYNVGITHIMAGGNVIGNVIDKEAHLELE